MPASAILYGSDNKPKFIFGKKHRNKILFNPFSKYMCLSGFGNLKGDIDIWDLENFEKTGSCNAHSSS